MTNQDQLDEDESTTTVEFDGRTLTLDEARDLILTKSRGSVNFHGSTQEAIPLSVESKLFKPKPSPLSNERKRARKKVESFNEKIGINVTDALFAVSSILKDSGASDKDRLAASKIVLDLHSKLLVHSHSMISNEIKDDPSEGLLRLEQEDSKLPYTTEIIDT